MRMVGTLLSVGMQPGRVRRRARASVLLYVVVPGALRMPEGGLVVWPRLARGRASGARGQAGYGGRWASGVRVARLPGCCSEGVAASRGTGRTEARRDRPSPTAAISSRLIDIEVLLSRTQADPGASISGVDTFDGRSPASGRAGARVLQAKTRTRSGLVWLLVSRPSVRPARERTVLSVRRPAAVRTGPYCGQSIRAASSAGPSSISALRAVSRYWPSGVSASQRTRRSCGSTITSSSTSWAA